jgi:hypothetical protein
MKIDIVGWYGRHNVGDDAFQVVLSDWLQNHSVSFITPPNMVRSDVDVVILGGGAVTSKYYLDSIKGFNGPLYSLGVDTQYPDEFTLMQDFKEIVFRSEADADTMRARYPEVQCTFAPDLAFWLKAKRKDPLPAFKRRNTRWTLAVCATDYVLPAIDRDWNYAAPRGNQFCEGMGRLLDLLTEHFEIVLLPCSTGDYGNDRRVNLNIAAYMAKRPTIIDYQLDPQTMINLLTQCDVALCQRFHSHVFALIAGTPIVSIEFTKKVKTLMSDFQTWISRPLTGIFKKDSGYFEFDRAYDSILAAANTGACERAQSLAYAAMQRTALESTRETVLKRWELAV